MRTKFSEILKRRPAGRGGARDERTSDYSRIPDNPNPFPRESYELAGDTTAQAQAATASSAQPGPSGLSASGSRELENAENLRILARKQDEKRARFLERAQEAFEAGKIQLWKKLKKLAEKCLKAKAKFNKKAAEIIFWVKNKGAKRGEIDLHLLHVPEAIEKAEQSIQAATSKGGQTIRFITGKGKHSKEGPKILPALQEYIGKRGLKSEMDPKNEGVLVVYLQQQDP